MNTMVHCRAHALGQPGDAPIVLHLYSHAFLRVNKKAKWVDSKCNMAQKHEEAESPVD